jgi:Flp pilus assembly protein TadG
MASMTTPDLRGSGPVARIRSERGAELVEFALIFPLLLLVMLGIMDFGFLFQRYEVLTAAAREGARVAILPGYTNGDVTARVNAYLTAGGLSDPATVQVGAPQAISVGSQCVTVRPVTVTYTYQYLFVGPIMSFFGEPALGTRQLNATAAMRHELAAEPCS